MTKTIKNKVVKFVGVDQITYKNGKESSRTQANRIPLYRNRLKQSRSFFRTKFQMKSNHYEIKLHFQTLSFSQILANYVDSMFIHCFPNPLIELVQTLQQPRQLREVQAPKAISEKDSWYREIQRQVKNVMASLCCHGNSDVN